MSGVDHADPEGLPAPNGAGPNGAGPDDSGLPGFTVIVPTHARLDRLTQCLSALAGLDYPRDRLQVVVVDDASPQSVGPLIDTFKETLDVDLIEQAKAGPAVARNTGAVRARHEYLAFTDDDCATDPQWLRELATVFRLAPDAMLGGHTVNDLSRDLCAAASQDLVSYLYEYFNQPSTVRFLTSNNLAVPTRGFRELGGFSASFPLAAAEDRDLCERWLEAGHEMRYVPTAIVRHSHHLSLRSFWRQHFGYGRGAFGYHQRRAARGATGVRLEPLRFYTGLLTYPVRRRRGLRAPVISALLFLSQAANALGYFYEKGRSAQSTG